MWLEGPAEPRLGDPRLNELAAAGVDLCLTACPYCRTMIADGAGRAAIPAIRDVVELIAHAHHPNTALVPAWGQE
jgi:Fe-S oxidoreductase